MSYQHQQDKVASFFIVTVPYSINSEALDSIYVTVYLFLAGLVAFINDVLRYNLVPQYLNALCSVPYRDGSFLWQLNNPHLQCTKREPGVPKITKTPRLSENKKSSVTFF